MFSFFSFGVGNTWYYFYKFSTVNFIFISDFRFVIQLSLCKRSWFGATSKHPRVCEYEFWTLGCVILALKDQIKKETRSKTMHTKYTPLLLSPTKRFSHTIHYFPLSKCRFYFDGTLVITLKCQHPYIRIEYKWQDIKLIIQLLNIGINELR